MTRRPPSSTLTYTRFPSTTLCRSVLVAPLVLRAAGIVEQAHGQAGAEHGLGAQQVAQRAQVELRGVEVLRIRPEAQPGAGVALADAADHFQLRGAVAVGERHPVFVAVALDVPVQPRRQRVDNADADAVPAAAECVVLFAELAARLARKSVV